MFVIDLSLAFVGAEHLIRYYAIFKKDLTRKRTFSAINVSNNHQVQVMLFFLSRLNELTVYVVLDIRIGRIQSFFVNLLDDNIDRTISRAGRL